MIKSLNRKNSKLCLWPTYEFDDNRCLRVDVVFGGGPALLGRVETDDAQILQQFPVRREDDARFIQINRYVQFGPLVATCARRQRLRPCRFDVRQRSGVFQEFAGRRFLEDAPVSLSVVREQPADGREQKNAAQEPRTARSAARLRFLLWLLLIGLPESDLENVNEHKPNTCAFNRLLPSSHFSAA